MHGKKEFSQCINVEFEGKIYNAPSNDDKYLTQLYFDYMNIPPKGERRTHEYEAYLVSQ